MRGRMQCKIKIRCSWCLLASQGMSTAWSWPCFKSTLRVRVAPQVAMNPKCLGCPPASTACTWRAFNSEIKVKSVPNILAAHLRVLLRLGVLLLHRITHNPAAAGIARLERSWHMWVANGVCSAAASAHHHVRQFGLEGPHTPSTAAAQGAAACPPAHPTRCRGTPTSRLWCAAAAPRSLLHCPAACAGRLAADPWRPAGREGGVGGVYEGWWWWWWCCEGRWECETLGVCDGWSLTDGAGWCKR